MYYINKIVLGLTNPMTVGLLLMLVALIAGVARRRGMALVVGIVQFCTGGGSCERGVVCAWGHAQYGDGGDGLKWTP